MKTKMLVLTTAVSVRLTAELGQRKEPTAYRDNSGTKGCAVIEEVSRTSVVQGLAMGASFQAERAGFEPAVRFDPHTAFPVPHLRPLGHLSEITSLFISRIYDCISGKPFW